MANDGREVAIVFVIGPLGQVCSRWWRGGGFFHGFFSGKREAPSGRKILQYRNRTTANEYIGMA
jgi:hypothetical protein